MYSLVEPVKIGVNPSFFLHEKGSKAFLPSENETRKGLKNIFLFVYLLHISAHSLEWKDVEYSHSCQIRSHSEMEAGRTLTIETPFCPMGFCWLPNTLVGFLVILNHPHDYFNNFQIE